VLDNDVDYVEPHDMLAELREDNKDLAARLREVHGVCDEHRDIATASLIEVWIDETERRTWFLFEASRKSSMNQPDKDASVLAHIERLANEEHRLLERSAPGPEESRRLAALQTELDQCWDLLRQRRALREFGDDPAQARARDANVVKKYIG
jgi:hypothetical protein